MESDRSPVIPVALRLLTFRASPKELMEVDYRHFWFGLLCTWVVGMGRSWDDPEANIAQSWGVGSLAYVFALSLLLWATVKPLSPSRITYFQVLTFVCLVSPPALLYAIPVERFTTIEVARTLNVLLLCIVATWRVALLEFYLRKGVGLRPDERWVSIWLALAIILTPITLYNVQNSMMSAMGGLREGQTLTEPTTAVLNWIGSLAMLAGVPLLIHHRILAIRRKAESKT